MTIPTKNTDKLREEVAAIAVTFRALCAELTAWAEKTSAHYFQPPDVLLRARAALGEADEPAVPQGREPAAVTGRPSDEELLDLLPQGNESGFWLPKGLPSDWVDGEFIAPPKAIIAFARDVLARWGNPAPQPPADGEVADVVRWLRSRAGIPASPDFPAVASYLARAADLLECLEQVAYAASDFICGTRFPEFANEHGGIDRLMADLCRLVAQFEHGPRPVPGVDVPGPDGDWGGLAELCNAEGVDLRIGVPLLQRAREAWKYASQAAPVPAEGEVAELVAWLQEEADDYDCIGCEDSAAQCNRAAELLQRLNPPQPVPVS